MTRILYHLPVLPPKYPSAEALSQELNTLCSVFKGEINYLNPNALSPLYIPRLLFGFHQLRQLRAKEQIVDLHHIYNPDPFPFPIFRWLKKPVIYSLSSSVTVTNINLAYFQKMTAVTVYDEPSAQKLRQMGLQNVFVIKAGIDTTRFTPHPMSPLDSPFLVASAPWVKRHFMEKGIDLLLDTAVALPTLRLTFLWRGELYEEMMAKVNGRQLQNRVSVINEVVDVNEVLANSLATINLASHAGVVKAYPHSLMDSLAASRPVIISRTLAMASDVEEQGFGTVVDELTVDGVVTAVKAIQENYKQYWTEANKKGQSFYTIDQTIDSYKYLYRTLSK